MLQSVNLDVNTLGDNPIIAAVSGKQIGVVSWRLSFSGIVNVGWTDGAGGALLDGLYYGATRTTIVVDDLPFWAPAGGQQYQFKCSVNTPLILNLSLGVAVGGLLVYRLIPV